MCFARVKKFRGLQNIKPDCIHLFSEKLKLSFTIQELKVRQRSRTTYVHNKSTGPNFFFKLEILHVFDHIYKRTFPDLPLSPSFEILLRSRKCVPITVSPTVSLSLNWILIRWHNGGNISVKTICSFHTGLYEFFFIEVFPCLSKED